MEEEVKKDDKKIFDLIYAEEAKEDIKKLFPAAVIEDASDYIHEGRFSVEMEMDTAEYLAIICWNGMAKISLMFGVMMRTNEDVRKRVEEKLKAMKEAEQKELKERWDKLNGDEFFGMTFEDFGKMQRDAIHELARTNKDFAKFIGMETEVEK